MKININNLDFENLEEEPLPNVERFKQRSKVNKKNKSKTKTDDSYNEETKDRE